MGYFFRLDQWMFFISAIGLILASIVVRYFFSKAIIFRYALVHELKKGKLDSYHPFQKIFYALQMLIFLLIAFACGKPQLVDSQSNIIVEGIDIMLVLDASGTMQFQDYSDDKRSRFDVAKEEAIRFVRKRVNDALGLVIFGRVAISRCPLTMDKKIISNIIKELRLGEIDANGTMLSTALITAVNRLKQSKAVSKVIILLTDGEPSEGDLDPEVAIEVANKFGIKIYTVGIGSDKDEEFFHPFYGFIPKPKVNEPLLQKISRQTKGHCFMARNARDMRAIYDTIDRLEKTKHEAPLYSQYIDLSFYFMGAALMLLIMYYFLATFVWFSV